MLRILLATTLLAPAAALNVAVAGATGRVGRLVVQTLLDEGNSVVALARSAEKASEVLPKAADCRCIDFGTAGAADVQTALASADHLIWCASGFTESGESIDALGLKAVTDSSFKGTVVMCSSAGVTRPEWSESKSARLVGAADIPIIRLNPGGILQQKAAAEQMLRDSGLPYSIVRPTGLKFDGWPRGRPILSQGDVAVGRTNPDDLAAVLVGALTEPAAHKKTFEFFTLAGYPAPRSLAGPLEKLAADGGPVDEAAVAATYDALQQLLPGEEQDATKLEMGQSYEQVDAGQVARAPGAAPTERELAVASSVVAADGGPRRGVRSFVKRVFSRS